MQLSSISTVRLIGVHPDLVRVVDRAIATTDIDFMVLEGVRTIERQKQLLKTKATTTLRSRHITGHAVDLAPLVDGKVTWDWDFYHRLALIVKAAALVEKVSVEWGGDWSSFKDGPHWQLPWRAYP